MSARARLRGAIVWAVAPYAPQGPFRLWDGPEQPVSEVADGTAYARLVHEQHLDPEQTFLAPGKIRPVVILQERPRHALPEYAALRIARIEELEPERQRRVRAQQEPSLFYLPIRQGKYGMTKEGAIDLNALIRIHESAIAGSPIGRLDANELRVVAERLAEHLDLDLTMLVERKARELLERIAARTQP